MILGTACREGQAQSALLPSAELLGEVVRRAERTPGVCDGSGVTVISVGYLQIIPTAGGRTA